MKIPARLYIKLLCITAPKMRNDGKYKQAVRIAAEYFGEEGDEELELFCLAQIGEADFFETTNK